MKRWTTVGFGLCAFDYLLMVERYPALNQKTDALEFSQQGGGPVATAMATLGRLGEKDIAFVGKVGDDWQSKFIKEALEADGVDTRYVLEAFHTPSAQAFVWIEKTSGKRSVVLYRHPDLNFVPEEVHEEPFQNTEYLLIDGREPDAALKAARLAREAGARVIMDAGSLRPRMNEFFRLVDYFVCSSDFMRAYSPEGSVEQTMRQIQKAGPEWVVVTLGEDGSIGFDGSQFYYEPAFRVKVVDTTGAGDVFHGAFVYGLRHSLQLSEVLTFANAVAALKCERIGGREGIPDLHRTLSFLRERLDEGNRESNWLNKLEKYSMEVGQ